MCGWGGADPVQPAASTASSAAINAGRATGLARNSLGAQGAGELLLGHDRADDHRQRPRGGVLVQPGEQIPPVDVGEHHVEDDDVGVIEVDGGQGFGAEVDMLQVIAGAGQVTAIEMRHIRVIVDGQDTPIHLQQREGHLEGAGVQAQFGSNAEGRKQPGDRFQAASAAAETGAAVIEMRTVP